MENITTLRTPEEILETWTKIGFLEGLDNEDAMNLAKLMDEMANWLLTNEHKYILGNIETLVFPMLRRAYKNGGMNVYYTAERMCDFIDNTYIPFVKSIEKWDNTIDVKAEYCAFFSNLFSNNLILK